MASIEQRLVQDWKEGRKNDVEIFQAYEDIIQDGFVSLDLEKINYELERYNLFNHVTNKREIQRQIEIKVEKFLKERIKVIEKDPSIKIIKTKDKKYWGCFGIKHFCECGKFLRVKGIKERKVIRLTGIQEGFREEIQYRRLFLYCPNCGNTYDSQKGLRSNGVTPSRIG
ncbi:MAG: hypothetical protein AABX99_01780 [Nanoarchaeota archaeon]